jgi:hypothetical protein
MVVVLVSVVLALYLFIGVIVTGCREGPVALPNHKFWDGVWESVRAAFMKMFCFQDPEPLEKAHSQSCENFG